MISTHQIDIDGLPQVYHVAGSGPVCVVHSGGPGIGWESLRMPALEQHLTMVYLEPIGTGDSGRLAQVRDYRLDTYLRFLNGVVAHLGDERVFLLGHSHGGFVVQRFALAHPDRVAGLVLYDTSPVTGEEFWAAAMEGVAAFQKRHAGQPGAEDVVKAFQEALQAVDDATLTAAFARFIPLYLHDYWGRRDEFAGYIAGIRAWADPQHGEEPERFDVRARLGEITAPTLVVAGRHDFICGVRWAGMLHHGIPGSRLVVLENSGHLGHLEEPAEFRRAVVGFVSG